MIDQMIKSKSLVFYPLKAMHNPHHINPFPVVEIRICHL